MSNQAMSVSDDLMVGAGELYFRRSDDNNKFHHLGNVEEFTITNDVTTVEKNSSMNKKRELMASVTTAIEPSASITMNEYNPYNMALGLYGVENVHNQVATTLTNEAYVIDSVPGTIQLRNANGERYFNVSNVVVGPGAITPAKASWATGGVITDAVITSGTGTDDVLNTATGEYTLTVSAGMASGTDSSDIYVVVSGANTVAGQVKDIVVKVKEGLAGVTQTFTLTDTDNEEVINTSGGTTITVTVPASATNLITPSSASDALDGNVMNWAKYTYTPAVTALNEGTDYVIDAQRLRGGVITIPATSTLEAGQTVYVSATIPEGSFPTVSGAAAGDIAGELLFLGDPNIGGNYVIEAWKVKVTPDGDFTGLISDDFGSFQLNIKFLADYENHPKYPFYRATMIGKASGTTASGGVYNPKY